MLKYEVRRTFKHAYYKYSKLRNYLKGGCILQLVDLLSSQLLSSMAKVGKPSIIIVIFSDSNRAKQITALTFGTLDVKFYIFRKYLIENNNRGQ